MEWLEISYHATEENHELVSQIFMDAGSKGVMLEDSQVLHESYDTQCGEVYRLNAADYPEEGVIVKGYLAVMPDVAVTVERVKAQLFHLAPAAAASFTVTTLAEEDWAHSWKAHYEPIVVADTLVIKPSWLARSSDEQLMEILLDPGMAFGSGTHETTRLSLQLLTRYVTADSRVVDVGTGSGILAIAASKLGAQSVYGVDLDEMAVMRAKENVVRNDCDILLETNNLMDGVRSLGWVPNLIVANILTPIIIGMLGDVKAVLAEGGVFICSGIIEEEKEAVTGALARHGFEVVEVLEENGWLGMVGKL
ncbi:MAG: 50S ribosomal protein L11 methyltransferase [Turicibacter sp.]|nr:50S ribosomal protein L11 methyltransferase [Turicibacter sp.]